jgi:tyrosine-protein kinase Etk/Wzc
VVQVAAIPAKPVKPKKLLNIVLGIILGAVAGLGLAFFSEYTDQGLSTPERAERRLGLPVLATVPYKK